MDRARRTFIYANAISEIVCREKRAEHEHGEPGAGRRVARAARELCGHAAAADVEHVLELQHEEEEGDELRADDPRADLAEREVGREEQEAREDDDGVDRPVHASDGGHVSELRDARRLLQVGPYDLQDDEVAGTEEEHAVEVQPVLRGRPVVDEDGDAAHDRGVACHVRLVRVAVDARARLLRVLGHEPREHAGARVLVPALAPVRVLGVDLRRDRQVVQGDEEHPIELEEDDEDEQARHDQRQRVRVPLELALPHIFADEVELQGMHAEQHGQQARDERHVEQDERGDGEVLRYHAPVPAVVYIYSSESCAENVPNI